MRKIHIFVLAIFAISKAFPAALYENTLHRVIRQGIQNSEIIKSLDGNLTESSTTESDTSATSTIVGTRRGIITSLTSSVHQGIKRIVAPKKSVIVSTTTQPAIPSDTTEARVSDKPTASDKSTASTETAANSTTITPVTPIPDFNEGISTTALEFPNILRQSKQKKLAPVDRPKYGVISFWWSVLSEKIVSFLKEPAWFLARTIPGFIVRTFSYIGFCKPTSIFCQILTAIESTIELIFKLGELSTSEKFSEITRYALDVLTIFGRKG